MVPSSTLPVPTIAELLDLATARLRGAGVQSPRLEARLLLSQAGGLPVETILSYPEVPVSPQAEETFRYLVERRCRREPVAYILGRREFYGRPFYVDQHVLVPRPETELLVECALEALRRTGRRAQTVVDVGTGSGAIAVTLALEAPDVRVIATDISMEALAVARRNARMHGVEDRVRFVRTDLLEGLSISAHAIVANLPYIPSGDLPHLDPEVRCWEPKVALDGGPDGVDLIRRLLAQARDHLEPDGIILLEIGHGQGQAVSLAARQTFPAATVHVRRDLAARERLLVIEGCGPDNSPTLHPRQDYGPSGCLDP